MLETIRLYHQGFKTFNSLVVDPWFSNPISEWWMDKTMDVALKLYYWPFFAITWEDKFKEYVTNFSICKL